MKRIAGILAAAVMASGMLFAGSASAQTIYRVDRDDAGKCQVSIFGTIQNPHRNEFTLHTLRQDYRFIHVFTSADTRINSNGFTLQAGRFAGIYGCYSADGRSFRAEEVTLSANAQSYASNQRRTVTLDATIQRIQPSLHRMLLRSNLGYVWAYFSPGPYFLGEHVRVTGTFNPAQSSFNATSIVRI